MIQGIYRETLYNNFNINAIIAPNSKNVKVDSFSISIHYRAFTKIPYQLHDDAYIHEIRESDGQIMSTKGAKMTAKINGFDIRFSRSYIPKKGPYIKFVVTSKNVNAPQYYLEGITDIKNDTAKILNSIGFQMQYFWFEEAYINDLDLFKDYYLKSSELELFSQSFRFTQYREKSGKYTGFANGNRTTATAKNIFLKFYDKKHELEKNAKLKNCGYSQLVLNSLANYDFFRLEITIKNSKNIEYLENKINGIKSFKEVILHKNLVFEHYVQSIFNIYKKVTKPKNLNTKKFKGNQKIFAMLILDEQSFIGKNDRELIISNICNKLTSYELADKSDASDKVYLSRLRKDLREIYYILFGNEK